MTLFIAQGLQRLWPFAQSELITLRYSWECSDLQDEDEVVHRLVAVKEVVLWHFLVLVIIFELLDDVRMFQQAQEDFLWHLSCTKGLHLWGRRKKTGFNNALWVCGIFSDYFYDYECRDTCSYMLDISTSCQETQCSQKKLRRYFHPQLVICGFESREILFLIPVSYLLFRLVVSCHWE